jgi:hypothetical protein
MVTVVQKLDPPLCATPFLGVAHPSHRDATVQQCDREGHVFTLISPRIMLIFLSILAVRGAVGARWPVSLRQFGS